MPASQHPDSRRLDQEFSEARRSSDGRCPSHSERLAHRDCFKSCVGQRPRAHTTREMTFRQAARRHELYWLDRWEPGLRRSHEFSRKMRKEFSRAKWLEILKPVAYRNHGFLAGSACAERRTAAHCTA